MQIPLGERDKKTGMIVTDIKYVLGSRELILDVKTNQGKTWEKRS